MKASISTAAFVMLFALSACSNGLSGEYGSMNNEGEWEPAMKFFRDGKVEADFFGATTVVGTYELNDGKVYVTMNGATQAYPIGKDGCIDGGMLFGRMCKKP
jgi:hypothetical protein